ncbi:hypothetical protein MTP99_011589 [Tenebrio molitor]|jgi:hypothetical protein|nr:hypothetical protein MTP99_011589 [Tenebrio molitor]
MNKHRVYTDVGQTNVGEEANKLGAQATGSTRTDEQTDRQNMGRCCHLPRCKGIPELATSEGCSSDIGDTEDRTITNHTAILCGSAGAPPHVLRKRGPPRRRRPPSRRSGYMFETDTVRTRTHTPPDDTTQSEQTLSYRQ